MDNKRDIFISTSSQIAVRILGLGISLASVKIITNFLGTEGTGNLNTITTYFNFCIILADLGLFSTAVREISRHPEKEGKIILNMFWLRLSTALLATLAAVGIIALTHQSVEVKIGVLVGSGFIFFNLMGSIFDMILQYRLQMQYSALAELIGKIVALVALVIIVQVKGNFQLVVFTVSLSSLVLFLVKWFFTRRFISFKGATYDKTFALSLLRSATPLGAVFILNNIFFKLDALMVFKIKGAAEAGIYSVAYKVLEVTLFLGSYFASSLKPSLSSGLQENSQQVAQLIQKSITVMLFVATPISLLSIIFAEPIILFLSTPAFLSASLALGILSLVLPFLYLDMLLGEVLIAARANRFLLKVAAFMLGFNFLLNLWAIPRYSFYGAAVVTLLSEIILFGINLSATQKFISYRLDYKNLGKILLSALLTGIFAYGLRTLNLNLILQIILSFLIYFFLSFSLSIITPQQLRSLLK